MRVFPLERCIKREVSANSDKWRKQANKNPKGKEQLFEAIVLRLNLDPEKL